MNTLAEENYLKSIYHLSYNSINVSTNQIAAQLKTKAASVTDMLKKLQDKHPNLLKVVLISADDNLSDIRSFARKSQLKWTFLYYGDDPDILKNYDIRTIPTCFLIDKEGLLAISPAPLPSEDFEGYLFRYLKAKKIL